MSYDTSGLLEFFLQEAEEHIHNLEEGITNLKEDADKAVVESLFRSAHTIKGASALVKLHGISRIAHRMEDILEEIKDGHRKVTDAIIGLLLHVLDAIKDEIRRISSGEKETPGRDEEIVKYIEESLQKSAGHNISEAEPLIEVKESSQELPVFHTEAKGSLVSEKRLSIGRRKEDIELFTGNFVRINIAHIENILNLTGEITIKKNYLLQKIKRLSALSDEITDSGKKLLKEVSTFAERYSYSMPGSVKYIDPLLAEFGELEFDRYDDLNLFSRKVQEMIADITEALKSLSEFFNTFSDDLKSMDNLIKMLRTDISEMRMIEIGRLFQRFSRPVKEMAEQYGKEIELLIHGGDTKIDKVIFERLFDPLMHLIRNAIIHGIEKPEERRQKGKKPSGVIMLSARREGSLVLIEVHDNGRGIPTYRIFEEAVKLGLMRPDYRPSKQELLSLIFMPGFTTSAQADMGSGRGMGLDAVRNLIAQINGSIEVDSEVGMGTTFTIKVPTSLAITNVLVVRSENIEFVIPMNFVDEVTEIDLGTEPVKFNHRGSDIEVKRLSEILGLGSDGGAGSLRRPLVICNLTERKAGLMVDEIIGQEESIIKPMNKFLSGLTVYSGFTISGDGKLRFVLNPLRLFRTEIKPVQIFRKEEDKDTLKTILVVDDSLSVRKYLTVFLEGRNLKVLSATNGAEALNMLEKYNVDLIITDLEMPVMHGYELIHRLKTSQNWKDIPVVVLTSRSAEKHRIKALQSGIRDYLVKPFEERTMLEVLRKYIPIIESKVESTD